jgi:hypothetical protein
MNRIDNIHNGLVNHRQNNYIEIWMAGYMYFWGWLFEFVVLCMSSIRNAVFGSLIIELIGILKLVIALFFICCYCFLIAIDVFIENNKKWMQQ